MYLRKNNLFIPTTMRRAVILLLATIFCGLTVSYAQTQQQQVVVKTRGRIYANGSYRPGVRVPEAYVAVRGDKTYESDTRGEIKLGVSSQGYTIEEIKKAGYTLSDADILFREQKYSSTPLHILLENSAELIAYRREIERQVRRNYQTTLDAKQAEIDRLRSEGTATAEELERLQAEIDRSWDLAEQYVDEMTEHYLLIDFDNKAKFDQEVSTYILAGELEKADSLIATRGDLNEANRKHRNAKRAMKNAEEDLASRNYYKYQIASQRHERDSAAYWLEQRASLDRANIDWQLETASYVLDFLGDYDRAMKNAEDDLASRNYYKYQIASQRNERDSAAYWLEQRASLDRGNVDWQCEAAGYIEDFLGDYDRALNIYEPTLEYCLDHYGKLHEETATLCNNIGLIYDKKRQYDDALEYLNKAREIWERVLDPMHPNLASVYNNIGGVSSSKGLYDEALRYYNKALEIREKVLNPLHPDLAISYNNIGAIYLKKGLYEEALKLNLKSCEIREKSLDPLHPDLARSYNNVGLSYFRIGLYDDALEYLLRALAIQEKVLDPLHISLSTTYSNIGFVYRKKRLYEEAVQYQLKSHAIKEKSYPLDHLVMSNSHALLGFFYMDLKKYNEALLNFEKAMIGYEKHNHPDAQKVKKAVEQIKTELNK